MTKFHRDLYEVRLQMKLHYNTAKNVTIAMGIAWVLCFYYIIMVDQSPIVWVVSLFIAYGIGSSTAAWHATHKDLQDINEQIEKQEGLNTLESLVLPKLT